MSYIKTHHREKIRAALDGLQERNRERAEKRRGVLQRSLSEQIPVGAPRREKTPATFETPRTQETHSRIRGAV